MNYNMNKCNWIVMPATTNWIGIKLDLWFDIMNKNVLSDGCGWRLMSICVRVMTTRHWLVLPCWNWYTLRIMLDQTPTRNVAVNTTMVAIMNAVTDTARVSSARNGSERFVYYLIKMNRIYSMEENHVSRGRKEFTNNHGRKNILTEHIDFWNCWNFDFDFTTKNQQHIDAPERQIQMVTRCKNPKK